MMCCSLQGRVSFLVLVLIGFCSCVAERFDIAFQSKGQSHHNASVVQWLALIADHQQESEWEKLQAVNYFFNRIPERSDQDVWGQEDYWATPVEMLTQYAGDCEDYALAKYLTLLKLGVSQEKLHIAYVIKPSNQQRRVVLLYYNFPEHEPFILDNKKAEILSASQRADLYPVYAISSGKNIERARRAVLAKF